MPKRCVVGGCSNVTDKEKGVSIHVIPYSGDERPEAKRRRKRWVDFVLRKRANWSPSPYSVVCSDHFTPEDFSRRFYLQEGEESSFSAKTLKKDEVGVCVYPSIYPPSSAVAHSHTHRHSHEDQDDHKEKQLSERTKRKMLKDAILAAQSPAEPSSSESGNERSDPVSKSRQIDLPDVPSTSKEWHKEPGEMLADQPPTIPHNMPPACVDCGKLLADKRKLQNKVKTLRGIVARRNKEAKTYKRKST